MRYMLDTDISSYIIRQRDPRMNASAISLSNPVPRIEASGLRHWSQKLDSKVVAQH